MNCTDKSDVVCSVPASRSYRLTKKFRGLIELVELMSMPTNELLECWLLPAEELAERGGLLGSQKWRKDPQSLITKLLLHRDDPVCLPTCHRLLLLHLDAPDWP